MNTKTFGERYFSYAGPSVWNNLPQALCHSDSASSFGAALRTHLFNNCFWAIFHSPARPLIQHSVYVCACVHACVRVCVVGVIVKRPVLPPSVVDGHSRNPLLLLLLLCMYTHTGMCTNKHTQACTDTKKHPDFLIITTKHTTSNKKVCKRSCDQIQ